MLTEYSEKEWRHEKHIGETPVKVINDVKEHGRKAVEAIEKASASVKANNCPVSSLGKNPLGMV